MKIFNEEEVDNAACEYSKECGNLGFERTDFTAGVEYAESKVEDLCMEFGEWLFERPLTESVFYGASKSKTRQSDLFNQFLKEREQ